MAVLADGFVRVSGVLAFESLIRPDDKGNFRGKFLVPKTSHEITEIDQLQQATATRTGRPYIPKFAQGNPQYDGDVYRDGKGQLVPAYNGYWIVNAGTRIAPPLLDENKQELSPHTIPAHKEKIYSGVGVEFVINAFDYPAKDGGQAGVAFGLAAVRITDTTLPRIAESGSGGMTASKAASAFFGSVPAGNVTTPPVHTPPPAANVTAPPPVPAAKVLVQTGNHTIEALRGAGWTDEQMIAAGHAAWSA